MKQKITDEEFLELYNKGLSDIAIAKMFNMNKTSIRFRRCKFGLVANYKCSNPNQKTCTSEELIDFRKDNCCTKTIIRNAKRYKTDEEFRKNDNNKCRDYYSRNTEKRKAKMREYSRSHGKVKA